MLNKIIRILALIGFILTITLVYALYSLLAGDQASGNSNSGNGEISNDNEEVAEITSNSSNNEMEDGENVALENTEIEMVYISDDIGLEVHRSHHKDTIKYIDGQRDDANATIRELHEMMNDLTGWGAVETLNWEILRTDGGSFSQDHFFELINDLENNMLAESRAIYDIRNLKSFFQFAIRDDINDEMALRYAHRIIHDLDYHIHGQQDETFGVTEAFGNNKEIEALYNYIKQ